MVLDLLLGQLFPLHLVAFTRGQEGSGGCSGFQEIGI